MYADRYAPIWPGPAPLWRERGVVPNLFQRNARERIKYPSPERKPSKVLTELRDPEKAYFMRQRKIDLAAKDRELSTMDHPKTPTKRAKPIPLNPSPVQQKKKVPRSESGLKSNINWEKKKPWQK